MHALPVSSFLRTVLFADAAASGATGLLLAAGAGPLSGLLGLPVALMQVAGVVLLPYAALVALLGRRASLPRGVLLAVIAVNAVWAIDSIALLFTPWVAPTALGYAFVIGQAVVVGAFAELQVMALRRAPRRLAT